MSFGTSDLDIYVHLRNLLDSFQKRTLNYCSSPEDELERSARVLEIRHALTGTGTLPAAVNLATNCPICDPDEHCEDGACVSNTADSGIAENMSLQGANNGLQQVKA
jgi:hypothetical protein